MQLKLSAFILLLFLVSGACGAAELAPGQRAEIDNLLNRLGESGCKFNRNGTWYSAAEAKAHLVVKLNYLLKRKLLATTEQFIELAASKSSMSGKSYLVQCQGSPASPSASWLTAELHKLREKNRRSS